MITDQELRKWGVSDFPQKWDAWESLLLEIDASISLTTTQYEGLKQRYEAVSAILEEPANKQLGELLIFPQGSFRTRTVVRPPESDDVDIDAIAYVYGGTPLHPIELLDHLYGELKSRVRTGGSVSLSNRCVTIQYEDQSLPCHMDVTPAERQPGNQYDDGQGKLRVPDQRTRSWSPSNPKDFADWFDQITQVELPVLRTLEYRKLTEDRGDTEPLPSHEDITIPNLLRVIVRLMKRNRDMFVERMGRKGSKPISILITTLAAKAYLRVALRANGKPLSLLQILIQVAEEMPQCFDNPQPGELYRLENPKDESENFVEKWGEDPTLRQTFHLWLDHFKETLRYGMMNFPTQERFRDELIEVFGKSAGKACNDCFEKNNHGVYPGLSVLAEEKARAAKRSAGVFGLASTEPSVAARPKPLNRLG